VSERTRPIYSIGAVERLVGLSAATIRTWESRYRLVSPVRSPGGQRLYSRDQVDQLRFVKRHIEAGRRPGEAHRLLSERIGPDGSLGETRARVAVADAGPNADSVLQRLLGAGGVEAVSASIAVSQNGKALLLVDPGETDFDELLDRLREAGSTVVEVGLLHQP
jgi:DNA-binding transcriptional MerR regulator